MLGSSGGICLLANASLAPDLTPLSPPSSAGGLAGLGILPRKRPLNDSFFAMSVGSRGREKLTIPACSCPRS
ncbi:hypothetical protein EMIT0158MI4_130071 [Burkholderia ambifaria]